MKRVIRRGVFETNSSSMHSIVVTKENLIKNEDVYLWQGKLNLYNSDLEFDRSPFEILSTPKRKLCYAIASILPKSFYGHITEDEDGVPVADEYLVGKFDEFDQLASKLFDECDGIDYPTETKRNDKYEWDVPYCGYVDHDSDSLLTKFLDKEGITLYEFISNPKYIVVIDGDEYCVFNSMKEAHLINEENIVKEMCDNGWGYKFTHEEDKDL